MSRRDNLDIRCRRCRMHQRLCLCALMPRITTRTRLLLVIHRDEERKPSNTGLLAAQCLENSEVWVRGVHGEPPPQFLSDESVQPLLLYPQATAIPIAKFAASPLPITLIVPDGTWRQAGKVKARMPGLGEVPCVSLPKEDAPTHYRLRRETKNHGLATLEAIARAMGILEGAQVRDSLERIFQIMVERTLRLRGAWTPWM